MFELLMVASLLLTQDTVKSVALPNTPQGKVVQAYVNAFNSGDEKKFIAWFEANVSAAVLAKRSAEERAKMFQRMKGDFAKLVPTRVVKSTAQQIQVVFPTADGQAEGTFTFDFEEQAPYKVSGLSVEVQSGPPAPVLPSW
jgi:hypothetical protein